MWLMRGTKKCFYLSKRINGKPRCVYVGTGPEAERLAAEVEARNQARMEASRACTAWKTRVGATEGPLDELCGSLELLGLRCCSPRDTTDTTAAHGGSDVSVLKFRPNDSIAPIIPVEVQVVIAAANVGDMSALPALKQALADHPELIERLGDLAVHVERGLVSLVAGPSLAASEAITAHLARMRLDLGEEASPPLEKLLIQRLVLCWLACHAAEIERASLLQNASSELLKAADKRVDRAHGRLMSATKTLATVRKLIAPGFRLVGAGTLASTGARSVRVG